MRHAYKIKIIFFGGKKKCEEREGGVNVEIIHQKVKHKKSRQRSQIHTQIQLQLT